MREVIIALDFCEMKETLAFVDQFNEKLYVKVGMELFYAEGPEMIRELKKRGHRIFLDLKLHDIPTTVSKTMETLGRLQVDLTNVQAAGGIKMMREAKEGLIRGANGYPVKLIAVTQLTSTSQYVLNEELLIDKAMDDVIISYAKNAYEAGLDGVVCSPLESEMIHENISEDFITCTPGIRFEEDSKDDQVRITTPHGAYQLGSDYIVVGRSITKAKDPVKRYLEAKNQFVLGEE